MKTKIPELTVLITDDSRVQLAYAEEICSGIGIQDIHAAADGLQAIKILEEHTIDIVLVDLEMPIMDGVELLRHIAQHKLTKGVIILSAKDPILISSVGSMAEADGLCVLGTFQKPMKSDMLQCSLYRFLLDSQVDHTVNHDASVPTVTGLELNNAIRKGEVTLAYQPKLTAQGIILRGVEALARWQHPEKGTISPAIFIPLAERLGLMIALTNNLLILAFEQKKIWQQMGLRFHLAFNLSPLSLTDSNLADKLFALAEQYDVPPQEISFEVTENALMGELASAIHTLARLRLKGFAVSIDDYGTGFANAQQLSRVPATELKLDRSLVHRVSTRPQQLAILTSTVELAKTLKLVTVAEGVETLEDYKIITELGVDQVQGFYFSKPLYPDKLLTWIKTDLSEIRRQHTAQQ